MNLIIKLILASLVGVSFIIIGIVMQYKYPKTINPISGYRTDRSMKNENTWKEAQEFSAKTMLVLGIISTLFSILLCYFFSGNVPLIISIASSIAIVLLVIPITEVHLKKIFNSDGTKRNF